MSVARNVVDMASVVDDVVMDVVVEYVMGVTKHVRGRNAEP